jgi:nicotinate-nucleotide--dimethylbenzimidazole phosphoribosyltransferase
LEKRLTMKTFNIQPVDQLLRDDIEAKINGKTKPLGALGYLETIALKIATIQQTLNPQLLQPAVVVFAGDHGIAVDNEVNPFPQEVTAQMVYNFLNGGAAINVFCKQHQIKIKIVDTGVNHKFKFHPDLINAKIKHGTKNYLHEPAMTMDECETAIDNGADIVNKLHQDGTNIVGFGEMGIGNTSSASLLMHQLTGIPINECVGSGTGLDEKGIEKKREVLKRALEKHQNDGSPLAVLSTYGGYEIATMCGAMLQAAELKMILIIDGFIATSALLVASKMHPSLLDYCLFAHQSEEKGHQLLLNHFEAKPILSLNMRLGEGTGCAIAYPIIESAVAFFNQMASFETASVSQKS